MATLAALPWSHSRVAMIPPHRTWRARRWMQDWAGAYEQDIAGMKQMRLRWNWELDTTLYAGWDDLVAHLSAAGVRVMTYVNAFLQNLSIPDCRYPSALAANVLLPDAHGEPVVITSGPGIVAGLLDLSIERGVDFAAQMIAAQVALGSSGWMADFGEYVPLDSAPLSGEPALAVHNRYPLDWQRANALAVGGEGGVGSEGGEGHTYTKRRLRSRTPATREREVVWFARSSTLTSPATVPLFWLGDQLHSWDRMDGLASTVVGLLSSGLSGHTLTHSDTGGYTTIAVGGLRYTRSAELLKRWTELNTFTAFLRTHEGSAPSSNAQPYDEEALAHFARFSRLFASLAPYRTELMREAAVRGWPLVRPLWLHHDQDDAVLDLDAQFLLGADVLVAPVLQSGAAQVAIYIPEGTWLGAFSEITIKTHGEWQNATAPIGKPAVFVRLDQATGQPRPSLLPFLAEAAAAAAER